MKRIELTKGYFALVDDEDYDLISGFKWHASEEGWKKSKVYACRFVYLGSGKDRKRIKIRMHRMIMGLLKEDLVVDHGDLECRPDDIPNTLDNRKANLEVITQEQNMERAKNWCKPRDEPWL